MAFNFHYFVIDNKSNMNNFIKPLQLLLSLIAFCSCEMFMEPGNCTQAKQLYDTAIEGRIEKKYIWKENHGYRVLEIRNSNSEIYQFLCGWTYTHEDFYKFVEIGDSVKKDVKSLDVKVVKLNNDSKSFLINYNCPNMSFLNEK